VTNGESSDHQDAPWRSSLALIEAFRDLPPRQLADLEQRLIALSVRRGEVLVREGDSADALYLVVSGRFAVDVDGRHVAEVGSGAPIGEVAFFADGRRTARSWRFATPSCSSCRTPISLGWPRAIQRS
jgi:CRP-like cAMP-binding protein